MTSGSGGPWGGGSRALHLTISVLVSHCVLPQVSVKRSMKDETYFEVVESGLYITVLLGKALSVVWDRHLGISVFLKQTYQVGGPSSLPPHPVRLHLQLPEQQSAAPARRLGGGWVVT